LREILEEDAQSYQNNNKLNKYFKKLQKFKNADDRHGYKYYRILVNVIDSA